MADGDEGLIHYMFPRAGLAICGADVLHGAPGHLGAMGEQTCEGCLRELAACGAWPGAADLIRDGHYVCAAVMTHPGGSPDATCVLTGAHITRDGPPHTDAHGCTAPVLIHQETIDEVSRVSDARHGT